VWNPGTYSRGREKERINRRKNNDAKAKHCERASYHPRERRSLFKIKNSDTRLLEKEGNKEEISLSNLRVTKYPEQKMSYSEKKEEGAQRRGRGQLSYNWTEQGALRPREEGG